MSENNNAPAATPNDTPAAPTTPAATGTPVTTVATPPEAQQPGVTDNPPADSPELKVLLGGEQPPAEAAQPIQYTDFTMPEGYELHGDDAKVLQELGQQFQMPQEAVQKLVDLGVQLQQRQVVQQQQMVRSWLDAVRADPEYGGEKLDQSLLTAQRAFSLPRGDKVSNILYKSGLGNHPDVIGFMTEVGKLLESDNMVHGQGSNTANVSPASVWYDKS